MRLTDKDAKVLYHWWKANQLTFLTIPISENFTKSVIYLLCFCYVSCPSNMGSFVTKPSMYRFCITSCKIFGEKNRKGIICYVR